MAATLIDGKARAAKLRGDVTVAVAGVKSDHGFTPGLAVVLVGEDPASKVYVANKAKQTVECGMASFEHRLAVDTPQNALLELIAKLNADDAVDGILVQMPLPKQIDTDTVVEAIDPAKDVDGLHPMNAGKIVLGRTGLVPCTPRGCVILAKEALGDLTGKHAVVVGRSILVGKPVSLLLQNENCTVSMAHSRTVDLPGLCREADILVAAVGRAEMIRGDWVKPGACVIDVGINRVPAPEKGDGKTKLVGDVAFAEAVETAGSITPVPGGVGPMTSACLLANTVVAACLRRVLPVAAM